MVSVLLTRQICAVPNGNIEGRGALQQKHSIRSTIRILIHFECLICFGLNTEVCNFWLCLSD